MTARFSHHARKQKRLIESVGGTVAGFSLTGSGHLRFVIVTPDGKVHPLICASTPSDHRAGRNMLAMVKRWCTIPAANEIAYAT